MILILLFVCLSRPFISGTRGGSSERTEGGMLATPIPVVPTPLFQDEIKPILTPAQHVPKPDVEPIEPIVVDQVVPSVLTDLTSTDRLLITKRVRVKDVLFMRGKKNRFTVRTPDQTLVYTIEEENRWWIGYLCYGLRPLKLRVSTTNGSDVMMINRPYACTSRILPCHLQELEIYSPPGHMIGIVQQKFSVVKPFYEVINDRGDHVFSIRGPAMTVSFFKDIHFKIVGADGALVGTISKRWQGLTHALFFAPVYDRFTVTFERNLTVEEKAMLMAVSLLMDYMYYDS